MTLSTNISPKVQHVRPKEFSGRAGKSSAGPAAGLRRRSMLARIILRAGCVVPEHSRENEQITYVLEGVRYDSRLRARRLSSALKVSS